MNPYESQHYTAPAATARFSPANNLALAVVGGLLAAALAGATVATREPAFAGIAAVFVAAAAGIFIVRHPMLLLWTLILTAPFNELLSFNVGGFNLRPFTPLAMLGTLWITWLVFTRSTSLVSEIAWYYKGLIVIVVLLLASKILTLYSLSVLPGGMTKFFSLKFILFIGLQFAAAFVCATLIETPERLYKILRAWLHVSNIICFIAFIQIVLANLFGMERFVWHREIISIGRPYSVFREPDVLGCYYASVIVMLIPLLVANVKFINRAYVWLTFLVHAASLLLIVVRAGWVAVACCVAFYLLLVLMSKRYRSVLPYLNAAMAVVAIAVLGATMLAPTAIEKIVGRFASISDPKAESGAAYRILELESQFAMIHFPKVSYGGPMTNVLGHGDFSWSYWAPVVISEDDFDQSAKTLKRGEVIVNAGFNMPLSIQFDNGLLGVIFHGVFFLAVTAHFLKTLQRTSDPERQALLLATFLPLIAILVCYQFSYDPLFLTLWILLGIHLAAVYHVNRIESGIDEIGVPEPA